MLARAIEETGLPTVTIALIEEHAQRVKPPRTLWVPFPFGFALGKPNDPDFQHKVLGAALGLLHEKDTPVLAEFPEDGDAPPRLLQAGEARAEAPSIDVDPADEVTSLRGCYERWIEESGGRTMVGLSGVPNAGFAASSATCSRSQQGEDAPYELKPADVDAGRFLRLASDDIKAFYMEARFCQRPEQQYNELQRWFWSETSMGGLLHSSRRKAGRTRRRPQRPRDRAVRRGAERLGLGIVGGEGLLGGAGEP